MRESPMRDGLLDEFKKALIKGLSGSRCDTLHALSLPHAAHLERAVMTIGVIARPPEEHIAHPRATRLAGVRVVTTCAIAPKVFLRARTIEAQGLRPSPYVDQACIARVAPTPLNCTERRATLDSAVRFDTDCCLACPARTPVTPWRPTLKQRLIW